MDLAVIPECYIDTNLIETLVKPNSRYNHQHGCGTVSKRMRETFSNSFALGIIDKDKNEIDYLKDFEIVHQEGGVYLHKHTKLPHYIIQISPAIEKFILTNAEQANIKLEDYDLPSDLDALKKLSKQIRSKDDQRFKQLFKAIQKAGSRDFHLIASWVNYLKENPYKADIRQLKNF